MLQLVKDHAVPSSAVSREREPDRSEELLDAYSTAVTSAVDRVSPSVAHLELSLGSRRGRGQNSGAGSGFHVTRWGPT